MAVTQAMLDEAEQAKHDLLTGKAVAEFRDQNGETVKYSKADIDKLSQYIETLKTALGVNTVAAGPMRVWF